MEFESSDLFDQVAKRLIPLSRSGHPLACPSAFVDEVYVCVSSKRCLRLICMFAARLPLPYLCPAEQSFLHVQVAVTSNGIQISAWDGASIGEAIHC